MAAAVFGVIILLPLYFFEKYIAANFPPAINHPEFYYGFLAAALFWQVAYFLIGGDPIRYRVFMIPACLVKTSFGLSLIFLFFQHRIGFVTVASGFPDLILAVLFGMAFVKTKADVNAESSSLAPKT